MANSTTDKFAKLRSLLSTNAALATPFSETGAIDWQRLADHADDLLRDGLGSVTLFGTTGEGPSIANNDCHMALQRFSACGIAPAKTVQGVFQCAASDAAMLAKHILQDGAAGVLLAPPFYFSSIDDEALFAWFAAVFEGMGGAARDIILYNIPGFTRVAISPDLVGRLRVAFPQIVAGVKDSSGDLPATRRLLAAHRDLIILVGHEGHLAEAVGLGASGAISGIANVAPQLVMSLARGKENGRISQLVDAVLSAAVVPAIKALIAKRRGDTAWRRVRPPLQTLDEAAAARIVAAFDGALEHVAA